MAPGWAKAFNLNFVSLSHRLRSVAVRKRDLIKIGLSLNTLKLDGLE